MVQPSRIFALWQRLYTRFLIEPFPAGREPPTVSTVIQPITNADELLQVPTVGNDTDADLTGSAENFVSIATVPDGKRWRLRTVNKDATVAASRVAIIVGGNTTYLTINVATEDMFVGEIIMDEGDELGRTATGDAGDDNSITLWYYTEEDAF